MVFRRLEVCGGQAGCLRYGGYERLKRQAAGHRRSINNEVIVCIERSLLRYPTADSDEVMRHAELAREMTAGYRITGEEIDRAKRECRP